jgi:hypothetical protein
MRAHHWEDLRPRWEHSTIMDPKEIWLGFGLDSSGSRQGPVLGCCQHDNELSSPMEDREFLDSIAFSCDNMKTCIVGFRFGNPVRKARS